VKQVRITSPAIVRADIARVLVAIGACKSISEAKRMIQQGAVEIDGRVVGRYTDIVDGCILRCGKHFFGRLRNTDTIDIEVSEDDEATYIKIL